MLNGFKKIIMITTLLSLCSCLSSSLDKGSNSLSKDKPQKHKVHTKSSSYKDRSSKESSLSDSGLTQEELDAFFSSDKDIKDPQVVSPQDSLSDSESGSNTLSSLDSLDDSSSGSSVPTMISWISFDYNKQEALITVTIDYDNPPSFVSRLSDDSSPFETKNLIFTFSNTKCRPNLFHEINTAAFDSSIRSLRFKRSSKNSLDLVIKLKDDISYTKQVDQKSMKLYFPILDKYLNPNNPVNTPAPKPSEQATLLLPTFGQTNLNKLQTIFSEFGSSIDPSSSNELYISQVAQASSKDLSSNKASSTQVQPQSQPGSTSSSDQIVSPSTEENTSNLYDPTRSDIQDPLETLGEVDPKTSLGNPLDQIPTDKEGGIYPNRTSSQELSSTSSSTDDIIGEGLEDKDYTKYVGEAVEIEFYSTPLRQVLQTFADQSGNNFIFSKEVGSELITIKLSKVPWDAALAAILETYKLVMSKIGHNIIRIDSIDKMADYFNSKEKISDAKLLAEKNKILVIKLSNAKAEDIRGRMAELLITQGLAKKIKVSVDARTNALILEAPEVILSKAKLLVERLDVPIPQVEIASKLIEVDRSASNELGISWNGNMSYSSTNGMDFGSLKFPNQLRIPRFQVDAGGSTVGTSNAIDFVIGSLNDVINLDLLLKIGENKGTTEILQSNKVLVKDREAATIEAGTTDYFNKSVATSSGGFETTLASVNYNLSLQVTPEITTDGKVGLQLNINSNTPGAAAAAQSVATTNNRSLSTKLIKRSGETAVIGGIYDNKKTFQEWKLPIISSIPIIGSLFRGKQQTESHTELMILITPTIKTIDGVSIVGDQKIPEHTFSDKDDPTTISLATPKDINDHSSDSKKTSLKDEEDDDDDDDLDDEKDSLDETSIAKDTSSQSESKSSSLNQIKDKSVEKAQDLTSKQVPEDEIEENFEMSDLLEEDEDD